MIDFAEKREYFRMNVDCEIDYRAIDSDETRTARCSTLSGAGISFVTNHELTLKMELEITIQSQLPSMPPMRAYAKVVRVQVIEDQAFDIGASMTIIHDELAPLPDGLVSCF